MYIEWWHDKDLRHMVEAYYVAVLILTLLMVIGGWYLL